jgi:hypothetical protein
MLIELFPSGVWNCFPHPPQWLDPIIADRQLSHSTQTSSPQGLKFEPTTYNHLQLQGSRATMIHLKKTNN